MTLTLAYQTQNIPAPYAFSATFDIDLVNEKVFLRFDLEYLGRADIPEEEIIAEGYTTDDDFSWEGTLGNNWTGVLQSITDLPSLDQPGEDFFLHLSSVEKTGYPALPDDVVIQELIQGVFEAAEKEVPLTILVFFNSKVRQVTWQFATRSVTIEGQQIEWKKGYELMQLLYAEEVDEQKPSKKPAEKMISFDSRQWLRLESPQFWKSMNQLLRLEENG